MIEIESVTMNTEASQNGAMDGSGDPCSSRGNSRQNNNNNSSNHTTNCKPRRNSSDSANSSSTSGGNSSMMGMGGVEGTTSAAEDAQSHLEDMALNESFDPSFFDLGGINPHQSTTFYGGTASSSDRGADPMPTEMAEEDPAVASAAQAARGADDGSITRFTSLLLDGSDTVAPASNSTQQQQAASGPAVEEEEAKSSTAAGPKENSETIDPLISLSEVSSAAQISTSGATGAAHLLPTTASVTTEQSSVGAVSSAVHNSTNTVSSLANSSSQGSLTASQHAANQFNNNSASGNGNMAAAINAQFAAMVAAFQGQQQNFTFSSTNGNPNMMMNPTLFPLAFNGALPAGVVLPTGGGALPSVVPQNLQQENNASAKPSTTATAAATAVTNTTSVCMSSGSSTMPSLQGQSDKQSRTTAASTAKKNKRSKKQVKVDPSSLPPFLLFDAPIELRANFMAAQKAQGVPTMEDNNSLHYGLVVNGFHPQQMQSNEEDSNATSDNHVRLIDGRHGDVGSKKVRNVREQKRTQKIADLIDQLRDRMEQGGWKVGLKSKFHTLSSCGEYVKHLVQVNREKEAALEKAKSDLEAKRRKLEEDKNAQQDPSDPESTTSSLTISSGSANMKPESEKGSADNASKKRGSSSGRDSRENTGSGKPRKKARLQSHDSSWSSTTSSGGDDSGKQPVGNSVSVNQTVSTVSDLTDSNKGSSSEGNSSTRASARRRPGTDGNNASQDSVSSDAAVAKGVDHHDHNASHSDVVIKGRKRKSSLADATKSASAFRSFELDYKEVFLKSNVPQLLATTSGRIIAWNEFFLSATGIKEKDVSRLTIFSLVRSNKLSKLFEIVAAALRNDDSTRNDEQAEESSASNSSEGKKKSDTDVQASGGKWNYTTITLPCTSFRRRESDFLGKPLYVTVTLMTDADPRKRCFHCIFTDFPGTNGALGTVTPELLSLLFSKDRQKPDDDGDTKPVATKRKR